MEKILSQEEINALLQTAPAAPHPGGSGRSARKCAPFVFGKAARITKQQVKDVSQIHEGFAYRLKGRLSAYLQVTLEVNQMSVDEVQFAEFAQGLPPQSYVASIGIQPSNTIGILSLDLPAAFAMIDLMLGGDGKAEAPQRHPTEIEEKILQRVVEMICDELQFAWRQAVEISFDFDRPQRSAELFRLLPTYEKMLFLSFEIRTPDVFSTLTLAFPTAVSSLLLRKLVSRNARNLGSTEQSKSKLKSVLCDCSFASEMILPAIRIRGRDVLALEPGQTVLTGRSIKQPAIVSVEGCRLFTGYPVRKGARRGALVSQKFALPLPDEVVE